MNCKLKLILVITSMMLLIPKPAYAYIDPGAGSAIFQAIIATVAILAVSLKVFWGKINSFTGNLKRKIIKNIKE